MGKAGWESGDYDSTKGIPVVLLTASGGLNRRRNIAVGECCLQRALELLSHEELEKHHAETSRMADEFLRRYSK